MNKLLVLGFGMLVLLLSSVSAVSIDYFYHPNCRHCEKISHFIGYSILTNPNVEWNFYDVSKGSYNIQGTPTLIIKTSDCREITLIGSQEIPTYLNCELQEMTTKRCPTGSFNSERQSWFIR